MDKGAFETRAMGCASRLHGIAYAMLGNEADCEDAVSEALLKAWVRLDRLREPRYFETWLTRILINVCKSMLRKRAVRRASAMPEQVMEPPAPDPGLMEAVLSLPVKYRLPLVMHHIEGHDVAGIAQTLNLPKTTVKWRLHKAREILRTALAEGDEQR